MNEALFEVDIDLFYRFTSASLGLLNDKSKRLYGDLDGIDLLNITSAQSHGADFVCRTMSKGERRAVDHSWFIKQITNIWLNNVGEPKANNERLQRFTQLLLAEIGYPISETRHILKKVLG